MSLTEYRRKRDFTRTAEPAPSAKPKASAAAKRFVIQCHHASHAHFDLRLEMGGALKSWAVPKGMPMKKGEKRLAVRVEDHPRSYIDFEGAIPEGEYGGGTVMVWDRGTYEPLSKTPAKELAGGKLHFVLQGDKLRGEWYLVRLREGKEWLVIKAGEDMKPLSKKAADASVLTGRSMKEITASAAAKTPAAPPAAKKPKAGAAPEFLEPMKAKPVAETPPGEWLFEIKFDGWRALALLGGEGGARLVSRNGKDMTAKFPELAEALTALGLEDTIIDGEIVALDAAGLSSFQRLQAYDTSGEDAALCFYAFDLPRLAGRDLTKLPVEERKEALERLLGKTDGALRYSASLGNKAAPLVAKARKLGLEGLIAKRAGSTYQPGARSGAWVKLKLRRGQEFVIGGYTEPQGTRSHLGALLVGYHDGKILHYAGRVGTGFSDALLKKLHTDFKKLAVKESPFDSLPADGGRWGKGFPPAERKRCHWLRPELVCQVEFSEWTRDGRLRQPVFLGMRADKDAAEVVREEGAK